MVKYLGEERGIQGHQNSCYLDATVFGLFALSDVFDSMFLKNPTNPTERDISSILWKRIVNPLRKLVFVEHMFCSHAGTVKYTLNIKQYCRVKLLATLLMNPGMVLYGMSL